ncbi:MAG: lysine--tRNA ligase [Promethearchaeota archaeon]
MAREFPDHWLQPHVERVVERLRADPDAEVVTLSTGKTPSGHIHLGILREIIICDAIRRKLEELGEPVRFFLFFDSLDAAKRFPSYVDAEYAREHLGKPFCRMPSPFGDDPEADSYARYFGNELLGTFGDLGIRLTPMWTHEVYEGREMQDRIKLALEEADKVKGVIQRFMLPTLDEEKQRQFMETQENWLPAMVICEECERTQNREPDGSIAPNRALSYDPATSEVTYKCPACGHEGKVSVYSGLVKLNWRVDWPAKWSIYRTTLEPAGKDHAVKGGSYDTGLALCREVFGYEGPEKLPYEWLRLGDRDMSTSQGIVFTPERFLTMAHPELIRMKVLRTNPGKHISFRIEELAQMYDEYERMARIYYGLEGAESEEVEREVRYVFPLCQVDEGPLPEEMTRRWLPFRFAAMAAQLESLLGVEKTYERCATVMRKLEYPRLLDQDEVEADLDRARNWLGEMKRLISGERNPAVKKKLARNVSFIEIPESVGDDIKRQLSENQVQGLQVLLEEFRDDPWDDEDRIQNAVFNAAKGRLDMKPRDLFQAVYLAILGKKMGPRLGPFLVALEKDWVLDRLESAA